MAHGDGFHTQTPGLRLCRDSPGRGLDRVALPESVIWISAPVLLQACGDGPFMALP